MTAEFDGYETDNIDRDEVFEFASRRHTPGYGPPLPPERPVCHISERCEGCPYPAHGFVCWSEDGDCLRQRVLRIYQKKESVKYGAGAVE